MRVSRCKSHSYGINLDYIRLKTDRGLAWRSGGRGEKRGRVKGEGRGGRERAEAEGRTRGRREGEKERKTRRVRMKKRRGGRENLC